MCELLKTLPQMVKLGEGEQGAIYDVGNNRVMKVTYEKVNRDILYIASEAGIGPRIFGFEECPDGRTYYIQQKLFNAFKPGYASQIPELITRMFEAGLVHNDLKDDNMMADEKGRLYLIDFDLADKISGHGSVFFDKAVKKHSVYNDTIPIQFTTSQMDRIMRTRPTVEMTQAELNRKEQLAKARELAKQQMLERQRQRIEQLKRRE
jgi:serine/threonine protein kinase